MQFSLTTTLTLLAQTALLASGKPVSISAGTSPLKAPLLRRDGAPIPPSCSTYDSDGCNGDCPPGGDNFYPISAVNPSYLLYTYYLDQTSPAVTDYSDDQLFNQCLEECYGYGQDCASVYTAFNVPADETAPDYAYICQLYATELGAGDFYAVDDEAEYTHARYGDIYC